MIRFKKIEGGIKKKLPELIKGFKRCKKIDALYLFGSYAADNIKPLSDIDIAVLIRKNVPKSSFWNLKLTLMGKVMRILCIEEIDFVLLNEAPYELAYNILKWGKILFCRNEKWRLKFQEKTIWEYLGTKSLRAEGLFHLRERIRTGRFGCDERKHKEDIENVRRILGEVKVCC